MAHRIDEGNRDRIRIAHQMADDKTVRATENAYRAIAAGEYKGARDRKSMPAEKPAIQASTSLVKEGDASITWEAVRARWAREAVVPDALARACHHASEGVYCWPTARGVCGDRVRAARSAA